MAVSLVVGFSSALGYWRAARVAASEAEDEPAGRVYGEQPLSTPERARRALAACLDDPPLDVVVPAAAARHNCEIVRDHVWSGPLPHGMTVGIGSGIQVCRIAAVLVQLARELDVIDLARVAHEVTGTYVETPWADDSFQSGVPPLAALSELTAYAQGARAVGTPGAARLLEALAVTGEGSNSPRESDISIALRLSRSKGGYGLRGFRMNPEVKLSQKGQEIIGRATLRPDFLFPNKAAFEYDSEQEHLDAGQHSYDSLRREALKASGYEVVTLTNGIVKDSDVLTSLFDGLARDCGIRRAPLSAAMAAKREGLVRRLFGRTSRYWGQVFLE